MSMPSTSRSRALSAGGRLVGAATALGLAISMLVAVTSSSSSAVTRSTVLSATMSARGGETLGSTSVRLLWDGNTGAPVHTLTKDVTAADGSVTVDWVPSAGDVHRAAANGGWFNFTVFVGSGDSTGVTLLPRKWTGAGWVTTEAVRGVAARAVRARQPIRLHMQNMTGASPVGMATARQRRTVTGSWSRYTRVANVPSGVDMYTNFAYGARADSEIGAFVSSGSGWGRAGTTHLANTEAKAGGQVRSKRTYQYKARMRYHEYLQCVVGACWYERRATSWLGGLRATRIHNWHCRHGRYQDHYTYPLTTFVHKSKGDNRTYEVGTSIGALDFTAKSGYSTWVDMTLHFRLKGGVTRKHFCVGGSNHHWIDASTVYASSSR